MLLHLSYELYIYIYIYTKQYIVSIYMRHKIVDTCKVLNFSYTVCLWHFELTITKSEVATTQLRKYNGICRYGQKVKLACY